jgi:outer membrane protein assembly factor BamB
MNGVLSLSSPDTIFKILDLTKKMMRQFSLSTAFVCLLSYSVALAASEWTGWLGPNRNGWVEDFQPPAEWPDQLQHTWQVPVGLGYGTPLVSGDRIYQHARQGDEEILWCLSLKTGDTLWRRATKMPFTMGGGGESHGKGPKSNPTLADGRIFTMSITGVLSAFDLSTGDSLWQKDFSSRFEKPHPYWGATTSPLVVENRVMIHFGGDDDGVLVAFDTTTGEEVWSEGDDGASYSSPFLAEFDGVGQIVEWNHNSLIGVEPESGERLWEYPFPHVGTNQNMPTPSYHQGAVIVGGENRGIRSVKPQLNNGVWSVTEQWHQKKFALDMSSAVINGNHLYGFSHYSLGQLFCLDAETGKVVWEGPGRSGDNATFLSIPNHIIALLDDGELQVIAAGSNDFKKVASYTVAESPTWAAPVLLENGILIKDRDSLTYWSLNREAAAIKAPAR